MFLQLHIPLSCRVSVVSTYQKVVMNTNKFCPICDLSWEKQNYLCMWESRVRVAVS